MTYDEALAAAKKVGASKAESVPLLAITIKTLALVHAINPKLVYSRWTWAISCFADAARTTPQENFDERPDRNDPP